MPETELTATQLVDDLIEVLQLDTDELTPGASLFDLGLDSIRLHTLLSRWRTQGVTASFTDLAHDPTVERWTALLCSNST